MKVTIPEPVAVIAPTYALFWASGDTLTRICERTGAKIGDRLITTAQAEAYADARVREALAEVADLVDERRSNGLSTDLRGIASAIRRLSK